MIKNIRGNGSKIPVTASQAADILNRGWFTRVWILQELVFSSRPLGLLWTTRHQMEVFVRGFQGFKGSH